MRIKNHGGLTCRRHAPSITHRQENLSNIRVFPEVYETDWRGEWAYVNK